MAAVTQLRPAVASKCCVARRTPALVVPRVAMPGSLLRQPGTYTMLQAAAGPHSRPAPGVGCRAASHEQIDDVVEVHRAALVQQKPKDSLWQRVFGSAMRVAAVMGVAATLALGSVDPAAAASSGGRVGGTAGFSRSSASRSYYSGSGSHYSGSASRGGMSTRSMVAPRSPNVYHTTVVTAPSVGFGAPVLSPFGGFGYGYGSPVIVSPGFSVFRSMLVVMMMLFAATVVAQMMRGPRTSSRVMGYDTDDGVAMPVTVAKVQVALLAGARGLKRQLDELGASANTSTPEGLHLMMQEAVLALLRYPEYCVSAAASSTTVSGEDSSRAEGVFQAWSLEERSRIKQETLVNSGGRPVRTSRLAKDSSEVSELIVVTLLVAAEGQVAMPRIRTPADLRTALSRLGAVSPNALMAAEITWTPQAENDSLTQHEVVAQYPDLVPL